MFENKVLVATDLTETSHGAERAAIELADRFNVKLVILHVIPERSSLGMSTIPPELYDREQIESELRSHRVSEAPNADRLLVAGTPAETIVSVAEKEGVGLIVVGTRGSRGVSRVMLGSVAEAVARQAPCPVMLVRQSAE